MEEHGLMTKVMTGLSRIAEKTGMGPPMTQIHNKSNEPIRLIAISCRIDDADPLRSGIIKEDREKIIPAEGNIPVVSNMYDSSGLNSGTQIRILFRPWSKNADNLKEFERNVLTKPLKLEQGEKLFYNHELFSKPDLYLTCQEGKVIVIEDKNTVQEPTPESLVTETQKESALRILIEEVQGLRKDVQALKDQIATLVENFKSSA